MSRGLYRRKDRLIKERHHDPYYERGKWPEPACCPRCGAVFTNGRWSWQAVANEANEAVCPACRRITDNYPAGYVDLKGAFVKEHHDEILNLILNEEKREKSERPLERIITIVSGTNQMSITTTGIHIARRIGQALSRACNGDLSFQYANDEKSIRVLWQR